MSEEFSWYEKRELAGRQIVVTRARNKAGRLTKELRDAGAEVLEIPMIDTTPIRPEQVDLSELLAESEEREVWITFTSPTGVETSLWNEHLPERKRIFEDFFGTMWT